uniref:Uncharacterized protein n=1 Tax=Dulem virus 200 TaxID=3145677 RepID=A0AAU8B4V0_9VIRU
MIEFCEKLLGKITAVEYDSMYVYLALSTPINPRVLNNYGFSYTYNKALLSEEYEFSMLLDDFICMLLIHSTGIYDRKRFYPTNLAPSRRYRALRF